MDRDNELTPLKAVLQAKCPRCRQGNVFTGKAYAFKSQKMNVNCSHCNLLYEREPGYFYVAMFVSYAMVMAQMIAACVCAYLITGYMDGPWMYLAVSTVTVILFSPLNFRYSRVILLHWLTPGLNYQPDAKR